MLVTAHRAKGFKTRTAAAPAKYLAVDFGRDICSDSQAVAKLIEPRVE